MPELTSPECVVLGLIARHGAMTPYELKAKTQESVDYFWPIPHAQLYRIPARLAELGLLQEETEHTGRRRRVFHLTDAGQTALKQWLADPHAPEPETRDPAQLKLFFADLGEAGDVVALAREQVAQHRHWLELYRSRHAEMNPSDKVGLVSRARILRLAILHEQAYVDFWESLSADSAPLDPADTD
ncbi:PadR family transcriptional regulator [Streptosporangium sp. NBC_01639]|uniref:PadR family transcriptional regulator n=1 Tax=unclassified Streptosporangium TaxID=2632669 RepID=UPI002DD89A21|nr:PadR family transcriptional regulator [Streptosporangium sp. NBC_01756]WSC88567.1 PadR family transcriptional regulator [Streptosporangium sp. NBC_01756]WTD52753.1 PadR family transcriptional regulator [Streptosporangium sp. NBC_01639]